LVENPITLAKNAIICEKMRLLGEKYDYLGKNTVTFEKMRLFGKKTRLLEKL
jgi:hypothetical protein